MGYSLNRMLPLSPAVHGVQLTYSAPEEVVGLLKNELKLTMAYLQIHPKVYWIWNHRKWCLEHVPLGPAKSDGARTGEETGDAPEASDGLEDKKPSNGLTEGWRCGFWKGELAVIEALLDADPRNCTFSNCLPFLTIHPERLYIVSS